MSNLIDKFIDLYFKLSGREPIELGENEGVILEKGWKYRIVKFTDSQLDILKAKREDKEHA